MPHEDLRPPVLQAEGLTKRYGRRRRAALDAVDLTVPADRIIGLVGPNGAGKSTLLHMACGLIEPTSGSLRVLGSRPAADAAHVARVGFMAQDAPVYRSFTVGEHLRLGAKLNPRWDMAFAERRVREAGLDMGQKAGGLSGGQRAQLALTVAAAKRPDLLIFDEPAAALDPLARQAFLHSLLRFVAELDASAVLSSHLLEDVQRVCDHIIVLSDARVQVAGDVRDLLARHRKMTGPPGRPPEPPPGVEVIGVARDDHGSRTVVRIGAAPVQSVEPGGPGLEAVSLEELVLAYMARAEMPRSGAFQEVSR
ncbi:ABC transporter ATP-binding protein [Actinomadura rupiterrae]|uniref:ABC transporter ATP-binding protein n=1 Tax=Actinomadura rupiterrae TaxID=559627 RepID=UPI0020A5A30D|nr:ABC transporter ATP-binding protein [Actinomadura rupiterrae]MCP2338669.1 ABC-2 type transport system ATP-binding protein [Actinomadura rupiterrae]